jgi:hypothetical protein
MLKKTALVHCGRIHRPRAVVESQHDFLVLQEVVSLEVLETETRPARRIDLDHARNAERVRIVALRRGLLGDSRAAKSRHREHQSHRQSATHSLLPCRKTVAAIQT